MTLLNPFLTRNNFFSRLGFYSPFTNEGYLDEDAFHKHQSESANSLTRIQSPAWKGIKIPADPIKARLKLKFLIRKGIPDYLKANIWLTVTGTLHSLNKLTLSKQATYKDRLQDVFGSKVPDKYARAWIKRI